MYHCQLTPPLLIANPVSCTSLVLIISINSYVINNILDLSCSSSISYSGGLLAGALIVEFVVLVITMVIIIIVVVAYMRKRRCGHSTSVFMCKECLTSANTVILLLQGQRRYLLTTGKGLKPCHV